MNQRMRIPEVLTQVIDRSTNLRQLHLVLTAQRVEDVRFGEVVKRQSRTRPIREFYDGFGSPACAGP
jgi:hypothetical protein